METVKHALPWELLYAVDLVVIAESKEGLIDKLSRWKEEVEGKGIKVNMNKTKVMISRESHNWVQSTGKWPSLVVDVFVETQYSVLTARNWYT